VILVGGLLAFFLLRQSGGTAPGGSAVLAATAGPAQVQADGAGYFLAPLFTPEVQYWAASIRSWAAQAGLDANLVATVMQIESCGNPSARSSAGAMGLFQVMPFHFYVLDDPYKPATNAARGLAYLKRSLVAAGQDARLALAGYNGGISVIARRESTWAAETQRYVYWGGGIYSDALNRASASGRLQEWLSAGGAGMCRRAGQKLGILP
jgi:soluble lytic murein transglycosylase-like protein